MVAKGITIHWTYKVYDYLFNHIEQMKQQLQPQKAGDGCQINHAGHFLEALKVAEQKLWKYYAQTDQNDAYFARHFMNPMLKDSLFRKDSWINVDGNPDTDIDPDSDDDGSCLHSATPEQYQLRHLPYHERYGMKMQNTFCLHYAPGNRECDMFANS